MKEEVNYFFEDINPFKYGLPPKRWIRSCLARERRTIGDLNFIFCSDKYLRKINKKYLNKSYLTDVISFNTEPPKLINLIDKSLVFGDIFISIDRVNENKQLYKTIFAKELKRVMAHGALHLIGFNDKTKKDRGLMAQKENMYIELN